MTGLLTKHYQSQPIVGRGEQGGGVYPQPPTTGRTVPNRYIYLKFCHDSGAQWRDVWGVYRGRESIDRCSRYRGTKNSTNLPVKLVHCHMRDTIDILEEGKRIYPRCPK